MVNSLLQQPPLRPLLNQLSVSHNFFRTRRVPESLTLSPFSALKGRGNVAQGKRLSAPPWVEVPSGFAPLPRIEVHGYGKMGCQSGGEGKGSGGRWKSTGDGHQHPPCPEANLWDTLSSVTRGLMP